MYAAGNPKTKKQLREWLASGRRIEVFSPGPVPPPYNGTCTLEGPHYPQAHKWYAQATIVNGLITSIK